MAARRVVAIAAGDPAGIGPEVSIKAALDPALREACDPLLVCDATVIARHARACDITTALRVVMRVVDADWSDGRLNVLHCAQPQAAALKFGTASSAGGRASLAFASRAIEAALADEVAAVVAAPQNETSIAQAGIAFDGYPSFVARASGVDPRDAFLMLCFGEQRIVHATLHVSVAEALALLTRERVRNAIRAADTALRRIGIAAPKIGVSGLNPHAGEGGLFGREEIDTIAPAITDANSAGIAAEGPFGADTLLGKSGYDAFVVMLHDQGHVAAKLLAPNAAAAMTIGTPVLFASVAHGSALDIAGKNRASPRAIIEAVRRVAAPVKSEK